MGDDPFVDLPRATRLTSASIYRLVQLGSSGGHRWHEETLSEILLGHLIGMDYTIGAPCPHPNHRHRDDDGACPIWDAGSVSSVTAGARLTTKYEEGRDHGDNAEPLGADVLLRVDGPNGDSVRFLIQAKRLYLDGGKLHRLTRPVLFGEKKGSPSQYEQLTVAAKKYGAEAYYMFCAETGGPHEHYRTQCRIKHTSPQDTAAILVPARDVAEFYRRPGTVEDLLAQGMTLACLADTCCGRTKKDLYTRVRKFVERDNPNYRPSTDSASGVDSDIRAAVTIDTRRWQPPVHRQENPLEEFADGKDLILAVHLGQRHRSDVDPRGAIGWSEEMSADELRDAARMWWHMDFAKAQQVKYVVAWAQGAVRACYEVANGTLGAEIDGRVEFEVVEVLDPTVEGRLRDRTETYFKACKPGARNPIGYP